MLQLDCFILPIDGHVEYPQLRHRRDGDGQFLEIIIAHIKNLQIDQVGHSRWQFVQAIVAQRESRHKGHGHWKEEGDIRPGGRISDQWDFTIMTSAHKLPYMAINRNSLKLGHSSIAPMFWSTRSISLHWPAFASARIFFTLDILELVTGEKQLADGACMIAIVTLLSIRKKTKISEMSHVRQWSAVVTNAVLILI